MSQGEEAGNDAGASAPIVEDARMSLKGLGSDGVPIICKRDGGMTRSGHTRRGSIRHRPRRKAESADRFDRADMRKIVAPASAKRCALVHQQCAEVRGTGRGAALHPRAPGADPRGTGRGGEGDGP